MIGDTWLKLETQLVRKGLSLLVAGQPAVKLAGALAAAQMSYTPPTVNVRYISPTGNDANPGTLASPMATPSAAAQAVKVSGTATDPATVVLRAGVYRMNDYQPYNGYILRFQAYPGEEVWFDGSVQFAGPWTDNGNGTWWTSYTAPAVPALGSDHLQDDPNALLPDMCFLDGVQLYQTADNSTPTPGKFAVNRTTNRLTIATNPAGREVRYSADRNIVFTGSRIDFLGVGIRRYRCAGGVSNAAMYYGGPVNGSIIENCRIEQMGRNVFAVNTDDCRITSCTFLEIGQQAVGGTTCDNFVIEQTKFRNTNTGKWQAQPISGAIKLTASRGTIIRHNHITQSHNGMAIWYDVSCTQVYCYGNYIDGTSKDGTTYAEGGIVYEECDGGLYDGTQYESLLVANTVLNCRLPIVAQAAGAVLIGNNTISSKWITRTPEAILIMQDRDDNHGIQVPIANCHWWTRWVRIVNNRIQSQVGGWQFLSYDSQGQVPRPRAIAAGLGTSSGQVIGGDMFTQCESNWFAPADGSSSGTSIMATIGRADGVRANYNTPAALQTTNATYGLSAANMGTNYQSAAEPSGTDHDTALPMEPAVATLLGLRAGTRWVGNPLPEPTPI